MGIHLAMFYLSVYLAMFWGPMGRDTYRVMFGGFYLVFLL